MHIYHDSLVILTILLPLDLSCVPGYRLRDWNIYMSSWNKAIRNGETDENRDECWNLVKEKFDNPVGIVWMHGTGSCRAIENYEILLPWPPSDLDDVETTKLCMSVSLLGKNNFPHFYYL